MKSRIPRTYESSDYASLSANGVRFYFGYEQTKCLTCQAMNCKEHDENEWCFVASIDGINDIVIPLSKLKESDREGMLLPLLKGIGWIFAKYKLVPIALEKDE